MKKILLFAAVALSFAACTKENEVINDGVIDASKVVFNIDVRNADATKGVKSAWEIGDVVYAFFEDNTVQYVKMTYNGSSWSYTDNADNTSFSGLALSASGKKVSAVYLPEIVSTDAPTYSEGKWTFGSGIKGYFQYAESVVYTVTYTGTPEDDIATLNATISLAAPANIVQVYVNETAPASGNEYVLNMTNVKPFTFEGIAPGGVATVTTGTANFPLIAYLGTIGGDTGYFFWGILANASAGAIDYNFQMVQQNAAKKYAVSSSSKTVTGKNLTGSTAINLTYTGGLTDKGKFVSLGYENCPLWATGNLGRTNSDAISSSNATIADPLAAGDYFQWGALAVYENTPGGQYYHENVAELPLDRDIAYQVSGYTWRIPSYDQLAALANNDNTTRTWQSNWTQIGSGETHGGYLITSNANGISLFFAAAGDYFYSDATLKNEGAVGYYWSATPDSSSDHARFLCVDEDSFKTMYFYRSSGYSIRPVKNI